MKKLNQLFCTLGVIFCIYDNGLSQCPQNDIFISINTSWSNGSKLMCPGQKIIIMPGATLTLNDFILDVDPAYGSNWNGFQIQGGGSLKIINSTVSNSQNGILAFQNFGSIYIAWSEFINNGLVIDASGPAGSTSVSFPVYIIKSNFYNNENAQATTLRVNNANLYVGGSGFNNPSSGGAAIWLSAFGNKVFLDAVNVKNFQNGIIKNVGGATNNTGLNIRRTSILGSSNSIINNDISVYAVDNILSGGIISNGTGTAFWHWNNFLGSRVSISNPGLSYEFKENKFEGNLVLNKDHTLTNATCNYWPNVGNNVMGVATSILSSWGSPDLASGNFHSPGNSADYIMKTSASNGITNYHYLSSEIFDYQSAFTGTPASESPNCVLNYREPTQVPQFDALEAYDNASNNSNWENFYQEYQYALNLTAGRSNPIPQPIQHQIEMALVGMGQCTNLAIQHSQELTESELLLWQNRAHPLLVKRGNLVSLLNNLNFTELISYLASINSNGETLVDKNNFQNAIEWMKTQVQNGSDVLHLSENEIQILSTYATTSFGDYTAILRGWLQIHYGLLLLEPENNYAFLSSPLKINKKTQNEPTIVTILNKDGGIKIEDLPNDIGSAELNIFDLQGVKHFHGNVDLQKTTIYPVKLTPGVYKVCILPNNNSKIIIKTIYIY